MKLALVAARLIDAIDITFDAVASLWRVVLRGAFSPDAKSYRNPRFEPLSSNDAHLQEVFLNAQNETEAKQAICLDAERLLPLALSDIAFDVIGPLTDSELPRGRPERRFLVALVRTHALQQRRSALPPNRRGAVEAFTLTPHQQPQSAFVFADAPGAQRRRLRRAALAIALLALAYASAEMTRASLDALQRANIAAQAERLGLERRIRLAERRLAQAETARAALTANTGARFAPIAEHMALIARHLPGDSELTSVAWRQPVLTLNGQSYAPDTTELALRRAIERATIQFSVTSAGDLPAPFEVRVDDVARTQP